MNLEEAEQMAIELIALHCPAYNFEWSKATRRFGSCNRLYKIITLSRPLVELNTEYQVKDTILHEIAHALTPEDKGHGWRWKAKCRQLGARPVRCYSADNVVIPKLNRRSFIYECPNCKQEITRYKIINKRAIACGSCCRKFSGGCYDSKYNLVLKKQKEVIK